MIFYFVKLPLPKFPTVNILLYESEKKTMLFKSVTQTTNVQAVTIPLAMCQALRCSSKSIMRQSPIHLGRADLCSLETQRKAPDISKGYVCFTCGGSRTMGWLWHPFSFHPAWSNLSHTSPGPVTYLPMVVRPILALWWMFICITYICWFHK